MTAPSGVKLPASVQEQVDKANELIKSLNAAPPAPEGMVPAGTRSASGQQWQPAPPAPPATSSPPPPAPAAAAAPPPVSVEEQLRIANARYASLQGKYNSETAMLR